MKSPFIPVTSIYGIVVHVNVYNVVSMEPGTFFGPSESPTRATEINMLNGQVIRVKESQDLILTMFDS